MIKNENKIKIRTRKHTIIIWVELTLGFLRLLVMHLINSWLNVVFLCPVPVLTQTSHLQRQVKYLFDLSRNMISDLDSQRITLEVKAKTF